MMRTIFSAILLALLALGSTCFAEDMKVGFVYVSPVGDAGYSYAHDQGRLAVDAMDDMDTMDGVQCRCRAQGSRSEAQTGRWSDA